MGEYFEPGFYLVENNELEGCAGFPADVPDSGVLVYAERIPSTALWREPRVRFWCIKDAHYFRDGPRPGGGPWKPWSSSVSLDFWANYVKPRRQKTEWSLIRLIKGIDLGGEA